MPLHPLRCTLSLLAAATLALLPGCSSPTTAPAAAVSSASSTGASTTSSSTAPSTAETTATPAPQASTTEPAPDGLPRGGREFFPTYRLFGYVGYPGEDVLGRLGQGDIEDRMAELEKQSKAYAKGRTVMPFMELIVSMAVGTPEADGLYRVQAPDSMIASWLDVARRHKAVLLLDIQPGRSDFMTELRRVERWLKEPDVGVALDPEWAVDADQIPGKVFGNTTGAELNECATYLSGIVKDGGLPEKVMVYHVLHPTIMKNESELKRQPGVVLIKSIDGIGVPIDKIATWEKNVAVTPAGRHMGFKLFFTDDVTRGGRLMTRDEVMALEPTPEYIIFE